MTASSEKDWSQQAEHMQVPKGRDQVSGEVSVPCRHATPVADALLKPKTFLKHFALIDSGSDLNVLTSDVLSDFSNVSFQHILHSHGK